MCVSCTHALSRISILNEYTIAHLTPQALTFDYVYGEIKICQIKNPYISVLIYCMPAPDCYCRRIAWPSKVIAHRFTHTYACVCKIRFPPGLREKQFVPNIAAVRFKSLDPLFIACVGCVCGVRFAVHRASHRIAPHDTRDDVHARSPRRNMPRAHIM